MAIVGVASVRIKPDLTEFRKELNAGLKAIKAEVKVNLDLDTTKARASLDRFKALVDGKDLNANLDLDTTKARVSVAKLKTELDFKKAFSSLNNGLSSATSKMLLFAKAGAAFTVAQSAASTLGPLLAQAAGAAALIPAVLLAGAGVMITMKLGADGIKKAFEGLKPTLDTLKSQVSASFESSLLPAVNNLKSVLPGLRVGFSSIATALGGVVTHISEMLKTGQKTAQLNSIFIVTSQVIQNIGKGIAPFLSGLINIGEIGIPIIKQLTSGIGAAAEKFNAWTASATGGEAIGKTITAAISAFKQLFQILQQVVGIATNVFTGLSSGAGGLTGTLLPALTAINKALGSEGMQKALGGIGSALATVGTAVGQTLGPVLSTVLPLLAQGLQLAAPGVSALVHGLGELIKGVAPALPAVGQLASVLGSGLGQVASALGPVLGDLAKVLAGTLAKAIPPLIPIIIQLVQIIGKILSAVVPLIAPLVELAAAALQPILAVIQALLPPFITLVDSVLMAIKPLIPPLSAAFVQLGQAMAPLAGAIGAAIVQIFQALLPVLGPLIQVVISLVQAFLPLIPTITSTIQIVTPIIALFAQIAAALLAFQLQALKPLIDLFGKGAALIGGAMTAVNTAVSGTVSTVTGLFSGLVSRISSAWSSITGNISGAVNNVKNAITGGFNAAVDFVHGIPGRILGALGDFGGLLFRAGSSIIQGLIDGIKSKIGAVTGAIGGVLSAARNLLPFSPAKEGPFSGKGWSLYSGRSISEALAQGITDKGGLVVDAMSATMNAVSGVVASPEFGSALHSTVSSAVSAQAEFSSSPITVVVQGDEKGMAGFIDARVEEGNRTTRRFVQARKGAVK
jgi:phage-related protein